MTETGELIQRNAVKMSFPGFCIPAPAALQTDVPAVKQGQKLCVIFQGKQGAAHGVVQELLAGKEIDIPLTGSQIGHQLHRAIGVVYGEGQAVHFLHIGHFRLADVVQVGSQFCFIHIAVDIKTDSLIPRGMVGSNGIEQIHQTEGNDGDQKILPPAVGKMLT